jgi:hypothetical protein
VNKTSLPNCSFRKANFGEVTLSVPPSESWCQRSDRDIESGAKNSRRESLRTQCAEKNAQTRRGGIHAIETGNPSKRFVVSEILSIPLSGIVTRNTNLHRGPGRRGFVNREIVGDVVSQRNQLGEFDSYHCNHEQTNYGGDQNLARIGSFAEHKPPFF